MIYLPWMKSHDDSFAMISVKLPEIFDENSWTFNGNDKSLKEWFPNDAVFDLSQEFGGKMLGDFIPNFHDMLIISEKLKNILSETKEDFEFYRISIRDHKKRIVEKPYYFAQLTKSLNCLDLQKSDVGWSHMDPTQARRIRKLVLDESKIPEGKQIFRLGEMKSLIIVSKDLAYKIYREFECRGMLFMKIELYGREYRSA